MKILYFVSISFLLFVFLMSCTPNKLLQVCPDAWIINEMPCVYETDPSECEQPAREYFVLNGNRVEGNTFNRTWVEENCALSPEIVS